MSSTAERGADARHDFHGHARGNAIVGFFAATSENERVAALEADNDVALGRFAYQNIVDLVLRNAV